MGGRHRRKPTPAERVRTGALFGAATSLLMTLWVNPDEPAPVVTPTAPTVVTTTPRPPVTTSAPPPPEPTTTTQPIPTTRPTTKAPRTTSPKPKNTRTYGGVKPHVAEVGHLIQDKFGVGTVIGVGSRPRVSDHPTGYALDFMVDRAKGDQIAAYVLDNFDELNVKYVIWRQRINLGSGWRMMEDRGGITANHMDHVHVSFNH